MRFALLRAEGSAVEQKQLAVFTSNEQTVPGEGCSFHLRVIEWSEVTANAEHRKRIAVNPINVGAFFRDKRQRLCITRDRPTSHVAGNSYFTQRLERDTCGSGERKSKHLHQIIFALLADQVTKVSM